MQRKEMVIANKANQVSITIKYTLVTTVEEVMIKKRVLLLEKHAVNAKRRIIMQKSVKRLEAKSMKSKRYTW